jgi:RNA polymerase sigma factor (sigma-70 family)
MIDAQPHTLASRAGALFAEYRSGDEARMGELVVLLTPILWHTARAQNLDASTSEDVIQSSWLALVRSADRIADPRAVLQWMIVTTRREAWRVSKSARRVTPQEFEDDDVVAPLDQSPESTAIRGAEGSLLRDHIDRLPARCRELIRVIAFADRPDYASVATAMGMPIGSIGPTRGRCLAKLRAQLLADPRWEGR